MVLRFTQPIMQVWTSLNCILYRTIFSDYASNEVLVRFEHLYEAGEHSELSSPATFQLTSDFFSTLTIGGVRETSLGGNVDVKKMQNERLKWNQKSDSESKPEVKICFHIFVCQ